MAETTLKAGADHYRKLFPERGPTVAPDAAPGHAEATASGLTQPPPREGKQAVTAFIRKALEEREAKGIAKYGTTLQTWNGRDPYADAIEEQLDLLQYLTQARLERADLLEQVVQLREQCAALVDDNAKVRAERERLRLDLATKLGAILMPNAPTWSLDSLLDDVRRLARWEERETRKALQQRPVHEEEKQAVLRWTCLSCAWSSLIPMPAFAGDGHVHFRNGGRCGPLVARREGYIQAKLGASQYELLALSSSRPSFDANGSPVELPEPHFTHGRGDL